MAGNCEFHSGLKQRYQHPFSLIEEKGDRVDCLLCLLPHFQPMPLVRAGAPFSDPTGSLKLNGMASAHFFIPAVAITARLAERP